MRVAEHRAVASGMKVSEDTAREDAVRLLEQITAETTRQLAERTRIFEQMIVPTLRRNHIIFYQDLIASAVYVYAKKVIKSKFIQEK